jgi:diguanylate cyclase (GGDEF)-like protein
VTCPVSAPTLRFRLRELAEARIERRAYYDPLTGLPNRSLFSRRLEAATGGERPRRGVGVLALDLDFFSAVNESFGHAGGDELLRRLSARLMRSTSIRDTMCRAEADRFLVLLGDAFDSRTACRAASRLMVALSRPLVLRDQELSITACVGVSVFPDHGAGESPLVLHAIQALGRAKQDGPASISVWGESEELAETA